MPEGVCLVPPPPKHFTQTTIDNNIIRTTIIKMTKVADKISPLNISPKNRISIWEKAKGMWKNKRPDPIRELEKKRNEW